MRTLRKISPARAFLSLVIPGSTWIFFGGSYFIAGLLPYLLMADVKPDRGLFPSLLITGAGGGAVAAGHFMLRIARILRAEARDLHPCFPFKERARCGLALLFSAIVLVGAALGAGISLNNGYRASLAASSAVLLLSGFAVHRLIHYRRELRRRWEKELLELEAEIRAERTPSADHEEKLP